MTLVSWLDIIGFGILDWQCDLGIPANKESLKAGHHDVINCMSMSMMSFGSNLFLVPIYVDTK